MPNSLVVFGYSNAMYNWVGAHCKIQLYVVHKYGLQIATPLASNGIVEPFHKDSNAYLNSYKTERECTTFQIST